MMSNDILPRLLSMGPTVEPLLRPLDLRSLSFPPGNWCHIALASRMRMCPVEAAHHYTSQSLERKGVSSEIHWNSHNKTLKIP